MPESTQPQAQARRKLAAPFHPLLPADRWEWPTRFGYIRAVLYTDVINDEQACRDDLWLATTDALRSLSAAPLLERARLALERASALLGSEDPQTTGIYSANAEIRSVLADINEAVKNGGQK